MHSIGEKSAEAGGRIGSGRFVLVVGPSGAGKDSLIAHAREFCRGDSNIVFPRRTVTRPVSPAEDHDSVSEALFEKMRAAGDFALCWHTHGLSYGLPRSMDEDIRAGRTAVCNLSRTEISSARNRYSRVSTVLITAPAEVLSARLAQRGREMPEMIADRVRRTASFGPELRPDYVIDNVGPLEVAAEILIDIIYERTSATAAS